jgi:hypothetical protein
MVIAAALLLILNVGAASAADDTEKWLETLTDAGGGLPGLNLSCLSPDPDHRDYCDSIISSVLSVHHIMVANHPELAAFCPRDLPTIKDSRAAFVIWYERIKTSADPQPRMAVALMPAAVGVMAALREQWPCSR